MKSLLDAGIPVASSCAGDGICGKCKIHIEVGIENLSIENEQEKFLKQKFKLAATTRIACQVQVFGNISIDTSYW